MTRLRAFLRWIDNPKNLDHACWFFVTGLTCFMLGAAPSVYRQLTYSFSAVQVGSEWQVKLDGERMIGFSGGSGTQDEDDAKWMADVWVERQTHDNSFGDRINP